MPFQPLPIAICLALLCAGSARADAPAPTQAEAALGARMVDAACVQVSTPSPPCDRFVLLTSETLEGMVDLLIVPGDGTQVTVARDFAFHRSLDGQRARLEAGPSQTLLVHSEQSSHGRYPWFETLTVGHHDGRFQVVGYSYSTYDRPTGGDFGCNVNLLSGDWRALAVRVDPESGDETGAWDASEAGYTDTTDVEWWSFREPPAHCDEIMEAWFNAAP